MGTLIIVTWEDWCAPRADVDYAQPDRNNHPARYRELAWKLGLLSQAGDVSVSTLDLVFFDALRVTVRQLVLNAEVHWYTSDGCIKIPVNRHGRLEEWPHVFEVFDDLLRDLLQ
jgi:hypothetical protein